MNVVISQYINEVSVVNTSTNMYTMHIGVSSRLSRCSSPMMVKVLPNMGVSLSVVSQKTAKECSLKV